jgi:hypothetical protein
MLRFWGPSWCDQGILLVLPQQSQQYRAAPVTNSVEGAIHGAIRHLKCNKALQIPQHHFNHIAIPCAQRGHTTLQFEW